jgi:hypothetical protein
MVSSWFNTNSKEKTSKVAVLGEQGKGAREAERRDVQPLQAYGATRERVQNQD